MKKRVDGSGFLSSPLLDEIEPSSVRSSNENPSNSVGFFIFKDYNVENFGESLFHEEGKLCIPEEKYSVEYLLSCSEQVNGDAIEACEEPDLVYENDDSVQGVPLSQGDGENHAAVEDQDGQIFVQGHDVSRFNLNENDGSDFKEVIILVDENGVGHIINSMRADENQALFNESKALILVKDHVQGIGQLSPETGEKVGKRRRGRPREDPDSQPSWLPDGWSVKPIVQKSGRSRGHVDKYYVHKQSGRRCRSKKEVMSYLETGQTRKSLADCAGEPSAEIGSSGKKSRKFDTT
ncbi:hypothetical protein Droror1_Dr00003522 [Drosera rotundifolia]